MKNFKTKIAILAISFVSFLGIQTASALEGLSVGISANYSAFMGTGKEVLTGSGGDTTKEAITEEDGIFDTTVGSIFVEYGLSDAVALGVERVIEDMQTPTNTNTQHTSDADQTNLTNTVKADFKDHTTIYANINMPFNTYLKLGYNMVDIAPNETNKIPIIASLVETRFGAVNKPTAQVKITKDITLGFINLNNSEKLNKSSCDKPLFFILELSICLTLLLIS